MRVYFLRHGIAVEADEWNGSDADRPLTQDGRKRMKREARAMADLELELDLILTSPLVRAKETAEFAGDALKVSVKEDPRLSNGFNPNTLQSILQDHSGAKALMLVGHEPSFSATIGQLIGGGNIDLKKGGLACVEGATLQWLIPPKVLMA